MICRVAYGKKYNNGEDGKKFTKPMDDLIRLLGSSLNVGEFIPWLAWVNWVNGFNAKIDRTAKYFDEVTDGILEEHMMMKNQE